jgi:hypothetical protein
MAQAFLYIYTTQTVRYNQFLFMLPLEVMGPGGSLSTVLVATPYWRDASRRVSWQAATATAAYSCDWTTTVLVRRLGSGWRRQRRSVPVSTATDSKFVIRSLVYSAFFLIRFLIAHIHIQPVNSAYFIKMYVSFFLEWLLSFSSELTL